MDPEQATAAVEALKNGDAAGALAILEAMIVAAVSGEEVAETADTMAPEMAAGDPLAADPEPPPAKLAALSALRTITGCESLGEAVIELTALAAARDRFRAQKAALDESARVIMVGELVKLGAETPATAYSVEGQIVTRLLGEPIADLRTRLVSLRAVTRPVAVQPPTRSAVDRDLVALSSDDQLVADRITDPAKKAKFLSLRAKYTKAVQ